MNINLMYANLSAAAAVLLVSKLAEFETEVSAQGILSIQEHDMQGEPPAGPDPVPAQPVALVQPAPRRGRPPKVVVDSGAPRAVQTFDRESAVVKLRNAVKVNYEACEAWLDARSAPGFLGLNDEDMAQAVAELCS